MTKGMQIGLIAAGAVVLTCFGGGYFLYNKYGKEFIDNAKVAVEEAQTFAATTDQNGCVIEAKTRVGADTNVMALISRHAPFIHECLSKSKAVTGFCDSVPDNKNQREEAWRREQCAGMEVTDPRCLVVSGSVQNYCHGSKRG